MNTRSNAPARIQELLQKIASGDIEPQQIMERYTVAELHRAREICFEDGYMPALIAVKAILELTTAAERKWSYLPGAHPARLVDVEISYLYDGEPMTEYAFLREDEQGGEGVWCLTGRDDIKVRPYAWRSISAPAPVKQ